jgi:hypothetical protein
MSVMNFKFVQGGWGTALERLKLQASKRRADPCWLAVSRFWSARTCPRFQKRRHVAALHMAATPRLQFARPIHAFHMFCNVIFSGEAQKP